MIKKPHSLLNCYFTLLLIITTIVLTIISFCIIYNDMPSHRIIKIILLSIILLLTITSSLIWIIKEYIKDINIKAYTDVTGVKDKKSLEKYLCQLQEQNDTLNIGIMMFDLNNLKRINDNYGHDKGDEYIQQFASFLTRILTSNSYLARFGGDEFVIVQEKTTMQELESMDCTLQHFIDNYNEKATLPISYAVGYDVSYKNHYYIIQDLMNIADQKMYADKRIKKEIHQKYFLDCSTISTLIPCINYDVLFEKILVYLNKNDNKSYLLVMTDIQDFHLINDTYGFSVGDKLLYYISASLKKAKGTVFSCRVHSDIFFTVIETKNINEQETIATIIQKNRQLEKEITKQYNISHFILNSGCCYLLSKNNTPEQYVSNSNIARIKAKKDTRHICMYTEVIAHYEKTRANIIHSFSTAITNNQIEVYFQPKVSCSSGKINSAEALVRWVENGQILYTPDTFIPILEETNDIITLDFYVYEEVFKWLLHQHENCKSIVPISLNVSPQHFTNTEKLISKIKQLLNKYPVNTKYIIYEITESTYINNVNIVNSFIDELHKMDILVSMDDFGSGYSSLNNLKDITFDEVKLDKKFISDGINNTGKVVIQELFHLLKRLNKSIVCEGVETQDVANFLIEEKCDELQGFLLYKPMNKQQFENTLANKKDNSIKNCL